MAKSLDELFQSVGQKLVQGDMSRFVEGITYDSRSVRPGYLFVCIKGGTHDGHDFAGEAVKSGAVAVLAERESPLPEGITRIIVPDSRRALAGIAKVFYDDPSRDLRLVGIVGTNGKTTTTYLLKAALEKGGHRTGIMGTIQNVISDEPFPARNTTPESLDIQELLWKMKSGGTEYVAMEVSSHAVELDRIAGVEFDAGVFTNITQDHLDFHGTFENYLAAKTRFFEMLGDSKKAGPKTAIINADDPNAGYIIERTSARVIRYGIGDAGGRPLDVEAVHVRVAPSGASFLAKTPFGDVSIDLSLTGIFNVYNALAALSVGIFVGGVDLAACKAGLESVRSVAGRFELVNCGQDFTVVVDYAHTPDGLENVLATAEGFVTGRKVVVFGCGGDRDRTKRPLMGEIAARYGDHVIITSDNPRSEDPMAICREIEAGLVKVKGPENYSIIVDRRQAIYEAVRMARKDDAVIIAGKGHETYQIFKDRTVHFDDKEVAAEALRERLQRKERPVNGSDSPGGGCQGDRRGIGR